MPYFRQAITTKYHGPGNVRGSRVSAHCEAGRVVVAWDHALDSQDNHAAAACALLRKLGWDAPFHLSSGGWHGGGIDGGYVFVNLTDGSKIA